MLGRARFICSSFRGSYFPVFNTPRLVLHHFVRNTVLRRSYSMAADRALGCLYGQAIGDSLGCRYEFKRAGDVKKQIAKDRDADGFLPIKGGGPFNFIAGQVTDDTEMAMAIVTSILREGRYNDADVACAFVHWYFTRPPDIGNTTISALQIDISASAQGMSSADMASEKWFEKINEGQKDAVLKNVLNNAQTKCMGSLSNGCLMRIAPIAIAGPATGLERLLEVAEINCRLTNPNEVTIDGVRCYVAALKTLLDTGDSEVVFTQLVHADRASITRQAFQLAYSAAVANAKTPTIQSILQVAREKPIPVALDGRSPTDGDSVAIGYIGVALQGAMFELLHAESFEHGLVRTVERGGDTDTNGCITGALLGAKFSSQHIPQQWKDSVISTKPERHRVYPETDLSNINAIVERLFAIHL